MDLLRPLLSKVGRLHALVKNHLHLRHPVGVPDGGLDAYLQGQQNFINANREILSEVRREADRAAQHSRACHELFSSGLRGSPQNGHKDRTVEGGFTTMGKKARKRFNWRKQQLFRQKEKARRVELAMRATGVVSSPSCEAAPESWPSRFWRQVLVIPGLKLRNTTNTCL